MLLGGAKIPEGVPISLGNFAWECQIPPDTGSVALRKGPRRFCPHRSNGCRALMPICRNSPLWQRCEFCNVLSSFWLSWLARTWTIEQRGPHVTCALIGTSRELAALNDAWVRAGGCKRSQPRYLKGQSRTCYQECGCHSVTLLVGEKLCRVM